MKTINAKNKKIISLDIITMKKNEIYNDVKKLVIDLGGDLKAIKSKYKSNNKAYWIKQLKINKKKIKTRNSNYNRALKLSTELKEPITPKPKEGTPASLWKKEIRRIRMRRRRILKSIKQANSKATLQKVLDNFRTKNLQLTKSEATTFYQQIVKEGKFIGTQVYADNEGFIGEKTMYVNDTTRNYLIELFQKGFFEEDSGEGYGSDLLDTIEFSTTQSFTLNDPPEPKKIFKNKSSKFFSYINTTNLDLSEYQIYNQEQAKNVKKRENCLIQTLMNCGIEKAVVNQVKLAISPTSFTPKKDITIVAQIINRKITLCFFNKDCSKIKKISYGKGDEIKVAIYESHYFEFKDNTEYSKFFINNYTELKDVENCNNIIRKNNGVNYCYGETCKINSLLMIHKLFRQGYFKQLDMTNFEEASSSKLLKDQVFLDNLEKEQELIIENLVFKTEEARNKREEDKMNEKLTGKKKKKKEKKEKKIYFADCESFTGGEHHQLYLLGFTALSETWEEKYDRKKAEEKKNKKNITNAETFGVLMPKPKQIKNDNDYVRILNVCDNLYSKYETREEKQEQMVYTFLNSITKCGKRNALVYFHNLKYDLHILERHLNIKEECKKDGQLYNVIITFKGAEIEFRCSYKLVPLPLGKFGKEFDLPKEFHKKEAISYGYYTPLNNNLIIKTAEYKKTLSTEDRKIFKENMKTEPTYNKKNKTFNPTAYYMEYLKLDCLVLKKGLVEFNSLINRITFNQEIFDKSKENLSKDEEGNWITDALVNTTMNIWDSLTISSLTDKYMKNMGCYDDVYEVKGNLRSYIAKAVLGGRVNVNPVYQKKILNEKIADYDGVSLYPSSEFRICNEMGLPKGKAKRLLSNDFKNWEKKHYSIMTIKINKVNKFQKMPFIAYKDEEGTLQYSNEPPTDDIVIDSITLQDYIKFHKIEYEIVDGVFWDEGGNKKLGEIIGDLFKERLKCKANKQMALSNVIKLMLNSSYGKTIMKKSKTEFKIVKLQSSNKDEEGNWTTTNNNDLWNSYVYNNFNTLKVSRKINERCMEVEKLSIDDTFNRGHIGCMILSMSKRIMNEVFDVANTHSLPIYYTDTDSIHLNYDDVPTLENEFRKEYNRELTGKNLGQFHIDFDMANAGKGEEIYAVKSIFLGKKSYIDKLESKDKDGNIIHSHHIRLKGITKEGIAHQAKNYDNGVEGLYEDLSKGNPVEFILNPFNEETNSQKVLFQYGNGRVNFKKEFKRVVKF